jgi:hypothetical protein
MSLLRDREPSLQLPGSATVDKVVLVSQDDGLFLLDDEGIRMVVKDCLRHSEVLLALADVLGQTELPISKRSFVAWQEFISQSSPVVITDNPNLERLCSVLLVRL